MLRCATIAGVLGLSLFGSLTTSASAQQNDGRDIFYESARNKIGLLRFCARKALLDAETADIAIKVSEDGLGDYPPRNPAAQQRGDVAETDGEAGILGPDGRRGIADFADRFNTTAAALCRDWANESLRGVKGRSAQETPQPGSVVPQPAPVIVIKRSAQSRAPGPVAIPDPTRAPVAAPWPAAWRQSTPDAPECP